MERFFAIIIFLLAPLLAATQSIQLDESPQESFNTDARHGAVAMGDVDNDGDLDLVVSGVTSGGTGVAVTTLYENDGTGTYTEVPGTPFAGVEFGEMELADVDNDGDLDLIVIGRDGSIGIGHLYRNDGDGNFTLDTSQSFGAIIQGDLALADIDLDLFLTGWSIGGSESTRLYRNDGTGSFMGSSSGITRLGGSAVAFADMDNDSDLDIIHTGKEGGDGTQTIEIYENDGTGTFSLLDYTGLIATGAGDIAVADTDNDGDQDILISGETATFENITNLFRNDGPQGFSMVSDTPFPSTFVGTLDFADFDEDGDQDILITGAGGTPLHVAKTYENQGGNVYVLASELIGVYLSDTALGDINGDGNVDAAIIGIDGLASGESAFRPRVYLNAVSALPVSFSFFEAHAANDKTIRLDWQTSTEVNNDHFSIEHSRDGESFEEIGKQMSNHVTTTATQSYSFLHRYLPPGWHYYRLKQVDIDGQYTYSDVVQARLNSADVDFEVRPNPSSGWISIELASDLERPQQLQIYDVQGSHLLSQEIPSNVARSHLDLSHLPSGTYFLKCIMGKDVVTKKVLLE